MLKSFKLYAKNGNLHLVLLEYGEGEVTFEKVADAIKGTGIEYINENAINEAISAGVYATIEVASPAPEHISGECWVTLDKDNTVVQANVYPPPTGGKAVNETDILREIKAIGRTDFLVLSEDIRKNLTEQKKNNTVAIFNVAERRDGEITVEISEDRRTGYMTYTPPHGGQPPTLEEALKKIDAGGIKFGVDEQRVESIISSTSLVTKQRIAGAQEAVNGADATIEYLFDAFQQKAGPHIRENDTADFRDLSLFENVEAGTPLVRKTPLTPGEHGTDVAGMALKAEPGKDMQLPKGKNTYTTNEDQDVLLAETAGAPKLMHGKVNVEEVLVLGDIDFSTGNINFNGNVLVKGVVNSGFNIKAQGDIICNDTVEGADLFAEGNILLKRGIKGMGKSRIEAKKDIFARFIERCYVKAGGSVIVDEALIHSQTAAGDVVEVTHAKGNIFGGRIQAGNLVRASFIGSEMAIKTEIEVGVAPHIHDELVFLNEELKKKKPDHEKASKNLMALDGLRKKAALPEEREQLYTSLTAVTEQLGNDIEEISSRIAELEDELHACAEGRVEARITLFPGVKATIKNSKLYIREPINKAILIKEGPDVVVSVEVAGGKD